MKLFGWSIHRGECARACKCRDEYKPLIDAAHRGEQRWRKNSDFYELLFFRESKKASQLNKLGQRIHSQREQIRRLKAALQAQPK